MPSHQSLASLAWSLREPSWQSSKLAALSFFAPFLECTQSQAAVLVCEGFKESGRGSADCKCRIRSAWEVQTEEAGDQLRWLCDFSVKMKVRVKVWPLPESLADHRAVTSEWPWKSSQCVEVQRHVEFGAGQVFGHLKSAVNDVLIYFIKWSDFIPPTPPTIGMPLCGLLEPQRSRQDTGKCNTLWM